MRIVINKLTMKKIVLIIVFLFVLPITAQYSEATITFKNGTELNGLIKSNSRGISFKKDENSKKLRYKKKGIDCIKMHDIDKTYCYRYIKKSKIVKIELLITGKVTLYKHIVYKKFGGNGWNGGNEGNYTETHYFGSRGNEKILTKILNLDGPFARGFKKATSKYFKDCPKLVSLIKEGNYNRDEIEEVVNYYNKNCE